MGLDTENIGERENEPSYHWKQYTSHRLCKAEDENQRLSKLIEKIATENLFLTEENKEAKLARAQAERDHAKTQERLNKAGEKFRELEQRISELEQITTLQKVVIDSIIAKESELEPID